MKNKVEYQLQKWPNETLLFQVTKMHEKFRFVRNDSNKNDASTRNSFDVTRDIVPTLDFECVKIISHIKPSVFIELEPDDNLKGKAFLVVSLWGDDWKSDYDVFAITRDELNVMLEEAKNATKKQGYDIDFGDFEHEDIIDRIARSMEAALELWNEYAGPNVPLDKWYDKMPDGSDLPLHVPVQGLLDDVGASKICSACNVDSLLVLLQNREGKRFYGIYQYPTERLTVVEGTRILRYMPLGSIKPVGDLSLP